MHRTVVQEDLYPNKIQQNTRNSKKDALGYKKLAGLFGREDNLFKLVEKHPETPKQSMYRIRYERTVIDRRTLTRIGRRDNGNSSISLLMSEKEMEIFKQDILSKTLEKFKQWMADSTKYDEVKQEPVIGYGQKIFNNADSTKYDEVKQEPVVVVNRNNSPLQRVLNLNLKERYDELIAARFVPKNRKINLDEISDEWLDTPNERIGGVVPRSFLDTEKEWVIVDLIANIEQGYPI